MYGKIRIPKCRLLPKSLVLATKQGTKRFKVRSIAIVITFLNTDLVRVSPKATAGNLSGNKSGILGPCISLGVNGLKAYR